MALCRLGLAPDTIANGQERYEACMDTASRPCVGSGVGLRVQRTENVRFMRQDSACAQNVGRTQKGQASSGNLGDRGRPPQPSEEGPLVKTTRAHMRWPPFRAKSVPSASVGKTPWKTSEKNSCFLLMWSARRSTSGLAGANAKTPCSNNKILSRHT